MEDSLTIRFLYSKNSVLSPPTSKLKVPLEKENSTFEHHQTCKCFMSVPFSTKEINFSDTARKSCNSKINYISEPKGHLLCMNTLH